jgi:hypothetical protein
MTGFLISKCDPCDALVIDEIDPADPEHVLCKGCGAKLVPFGPPGTIMKAELRRPNVSRKKGVLAEMRVAFRPQHGRGGVLGRHERIIDHTSDSYLEKVTICDNGEVTHHCEEALSLHRGHGSAKQK